MRLLKNLLNLHTFQNSKYTFSKYKHFETKILKKLALFQERLRKKIHFNFNCVRSQTVFDTVFTCCSIFCVVQQLLQIKPNSLIANEKYTKSKRPISPRTCYISHLFLIQKDFSTFTLFTISHVRFGNVTHHLHGTKYINHK